MVSTKLRVKGESLQPPGKSTAHIEYITNLQQQIFFLERKIDSLSAGAPAQPAAHHATQVAAKDAPVLAGGARAHLVAIEQTLHEQQSLDEAARDRLQTQAAAARLGEERALEEAASARVAADSDKKRLLDVRQELTAEIVGLQRQLDGLALGERTLRAELAQLRAERDALRAETEATRTTTAVYESRLQARDDDIAAGRAREDALHREIQDRREEFIALTRRYESDVGTRALRDQERLAAKDTELEAARRAAAAAELSAESNALARERADRLTGEVSQLTERLADAEYALRHSEKDRDAALVEVERSKMVSVLARFMLRKMRERMVAAERHSKASAAADEGLHAKLVRAEQLKEAIEAELAVERQRAAIREGQYNEQADDAVRIVAAHRELEERVKEYESELADSADALRQAKARELKLQAELATSNSHKDLTRDLSKLGLQDLRALTQTVSKLIPVVEAAGDA